MIRMLSLLGMLCFLNLPAQAVPFTPALLTLSAPPVMQYNFDGAEFSLPVTVGGTPANVTFLVFTKGKAASIQKVTNGHLGWHYVNNIDTCLYISTPTQFEPGERIITWDGINENGNQTPPGEYTYYLWGYDNISPRQLMTSEMHFGVWQYNTIVTRDPNGTPLARPFLYIGGKKTTSGSVPEIQTHNKWIIGEDPRDGSLRDFTTSPGWYSAGGIALQPDDYRYYFFDSVKEGVTKITEKYEWVSNGASILQAGWGKNGQVTRTVDLKGGNAGPGLVSDGAEYLFSASADVWGDGTVSQFYILDVHTGTEIKRFDLSAWWVSEDDHQRGGRATGGPTSFSISQGLLALGSHSSCLNQLLNPYAETLDGGILWSNGNGDYTGDHNFEPDATRKWVCNDYNTGPYKYNVSMDENLFMAFPSFNYSFPYSFGLYAPDGTGMGYFALYQENAKQKFGVEFINYGSAYDGLYTTNSNAPGDGPLPIDTGFWFVGYDSFRGTIVSTYSFLQLSSPKGSEVWESDIPHAITWLSSGVEKLTIEYSINDGTSWNLIADGVSAIEGSYQWIPAGIDSKKCLIRISSDNLSLSSASPAVFTVKPPVISVVLPNGGEQWLARSVQSIAWSSFGVDWVNIELSPDNGLSWEVIAQKVDASLRTFSWMVTDSASGNCLVRVSSISRPSLTDISDGAFTILPSYLRLTSPNGSESFTAEENVLITWTAAGIVTYIRIEFSPNNGTNWMPVAGYVPASDDGYIWQIPYYNSNSFLIRISDEGNSGLSDFCDGVFSVSSPLSVSDRILREFSVSPNSPNPFNPSTTISFTLPRAERVNVEVYNLTGQRVGTLLDSRLAPGQHSVVWNAEGFSAGVYLGLVRAGAEAKTIKMLLLK